MTTTSHLTTAHLDAIALYVSRAWDADERDAMLDDFDGSYEDLIEMLSDSDFEGAVGILDDATLDVLDDAAAVNFDAFSKALETSLKAL